jgi:thiamine biosynthesis lipoprotein
MIRLQQTKKALGSDALMTIVVEESAFGEAMLIKLWKKIAAFEDRFSRFIADSELSEFNARAGEKVKVSNEFEKLLRACQELSSKTGGLFNPLVLPALQQAGYVGSWPDVDRYKDKLDYRSRSGVTTIEQLQMSNGHAQIPTNSALDFGGIGKGYLLDSLSSYLYRNGLRNYWLSLGGDIICAGKDSTDEPWSVDIQAAIRPEDSIGAITNKDTAPLAIATSGITKRKGVYGAKHWHHIIDPRTGRPSKTDMLTATISTNKAVKADVFAKCLVILGSDKASSFIKEHKIETVYLQTQDGEIIRYIGSQRVIL